VEFRRKTLNMRTAVSVSKGPSLKRVEYGRFDVVKQIFRYGETKTSKAHATKSTIRTKHTKLI
jgi:hypothetical protein